MVTKGFLDSYAACFSLAMDLAGWIVLICGYPCKTRQSVYNKGVHKYGKSIPQSSSKRNAWQRLQRGDMSAGRLAVVS